MAEPRRRRPGNTVTGKPRGRPRSPRDMRCFIAGMDDELHVRLVERAQQAGISLSSYMRLLVSEAHDYHGRYLESLSAPLPMDVPIEELRTRTAALTQQECIDSLAPGRYHRKPPLRVDRELANRIEERVDDLDVHIVEYLTAIYRASLGEHRPTHGVQGTLDLEEEGRLAG